MGIHKKLSNRYDEDPEYRAQHYNRKSTMPEDFGTSTIATLESNGSFEGNYGTMYCFWVTLENGVKGEALAKSRKPPYDIGDEVEYEVAGTNKAGDQKLKVKKAGQDGPRRGSNHGSRPSGGSRGSSGGYGGGKPSGADYAASQEKSREGQRIGMCIGQAAEDWRATGGELVVDHEKTKRFVWQRASVYLAVAKAIEAGQVSVTAKEHAPAGKPAASDDDDVPF